MERNSAVVCLNSFTRGGLGPEKCASLGIKMFTYFYAAFPLICDYLFLSGAVSSALSSSLSHHRDLKCVCVCVCTFSLSPRAWYGKSAQGGLSSAPQALTDTAFRSSAGALLFESGISSAWSHQKPCGGASLHILPSVYRARVAGSLSFTGTWPGRRMRVSDQPMV